MRISLPFLRTLALPAAAGAALLLPSCQLSQPDQVETTLSFNSLYDSLQSYDSVVIALKDPRDGHTLDVVFAGKVRAPGDLEKRPTPHWVGDKVVVAITGYRDRKIAYQGETPYDGRTGKRDSTLVYIRPGMSLAYRTGELHLLEGDSLPFPAISITPSDLANKSLTWSSAAPEVVSVGAAYLKGLTPGSVQITVRMAVDTSKSLLLRVTVHERASLPEALSLSSDTLSLSARGAPGRLQVSVLPATASKLVEWSIDDASIASVEADGQVAGLKPGTTLLRARSSLRSTLSDSALVRVLESPSGKGVTAPAFISMPPGVVNKADTRTSLQWSWSRTGASTDSFVVRLNGNEVARQAGISYTVNNPVDGPYLLEVAEKDLAGNMSNFAAATGVVVDRTPPNAPEVLQPPTPRRAAQWAWQSGGGGKGKFQCQLDGGTIFECSSPYSLPNPTDGDHTLKVRESDEAGNSGTFSSSTVTIDLQKPLIGLSAYNKQVPTQIFSEVPAFTGTASDERQLRYIRVVVGGDTVLASGMSSWSVTPPLPQGTHTITFIAEDVAGNQATSQLLVTYEPDVVFVRKNASGAKDGTSWENAFPELGPLLVAEKTYGTGKRFWVSEGEYDASSLDGFEVHSNVSVIGGFAAEGTDRSIDSRDVQHNVTVLGAYADGGAHVLGNIPDKKDANGVYSENILLSDLKIKNGRIPVSITQARKVTLKGITVSSLVDLLAAMLISSSTVDISDSYITQNQSSEGGIESASGSKVRLVRTAVYLNASGAGGLTLEDGDICAGNQTTITGNNPAEVAVYSGKFTYENSVTIGDHGISDGSKNQVPACLAPF